MKSIEKKFLERKPRYPAGTHFAVESVCQTALESNEPFKMRLTFQDFPPNKSAADLTQAWVLGLRLSMFLIFVFKTFSVKIFKILKIKAENTVETGKVDHLAPGWVLIIFGVRASRSAWSVLFAQSAAPPGSTVYAAAQGIAFSLSMH